MVPYVEGWAKWLAEQRAEFSRDDGTWTKAWLQPYEDLQKAQAKRDTSEIARLKEFIAGQEVPPLDDEYMNFYKRQFVKPYHAPMGRWNIS
jgi:hypothetical protein